MTIMKSVVILSACAFLAFASKASAYAVIIKGTGVTTSGTGPSAIVTSGPSEAVLEDNYLDNFGNCVCAGGATEVTGVIGYQYAVSSFTYNSVTAMETITFSGSNYETGVEGFLLQSGDGVTVSFADATPYVVGTPLATEAATGSGGSSFSEVSGYGLNYNFTTTFTPTSIRIVTGDTNIIASLPEPATWALMFLGVGMAGGALRMRRREFNSLATT